jgi:hypothetical protein
VLAHGTVSLPKEAVMDRFACASRSLIRALDYRQVPIFQSNHPVMACRPRDQCYCPFDTKRRGSRFFQFQCRESAVH